MSDDQLLTTASTVVLASNHFLLATNSWEALPCEHKTWTAWKAHYRAVHLAQKCQLLASHQAPPSHGTANAATPTGDTKANESTFTKLDTYLDNLEAIATSDQTAFQQLLNNNATLTASIASLTSSLASSPWHIPS